VPRNAARRAPKGKEAHPVSTLQIAVEEFRDVIDVGGVTLDAVALVVVGGHRDENHPSIGGEPVETEDVTVGWHGLRAPVDFGAVLHLDHGFAKGLPRVWRRRLTNPPELLL
jgi:hypothetical protein